MVMNSKLSQALRGNTNAAKNHVKKMVEGGKSLASDIKSTIKGTPGNNGIKQAGKDIAAAAKRVGGAFASTAKAAGAAASNTLVQKKANTFAGKVGAKIGGLAESASMRASGALAGAKAGAKVGKFVGGTKSAVKGAITGAKLGNKAGGIAAKISKAGENAGTRRGDAIARTASAGISKVKAAGKAAIGNAKSAYYTRKTSKMNPRDRH